MRTLLRTLFLLSTLLLLATPIIQASESNGKKFVNVIVHYTVVVSLSLSWVGAFNSHCVAGLMGKSLVFLFPQSKSIAVSDE